MAHNLLLPPFCNVACHATSPTCFGVFLATFLLPLASFLATALLPWVLSHRVPSLASFASLFRSHSFFNSLPSSLVVSLQREMHKSFGLLRFSIFHHRLSPPFQFSQTDTSADTYETTSFLIRD